MLLIEQTAEQNKHTTIKNLKKEPHHGKAERRVKRHDGYGINSRPPPATSSRKGFILRLKPAKKIINLIKASI